MFYYLCFQVVQQKMNREVARTISSDLREGGSGGEEKGGEEEGGEEGEEGRGRASARKFAPRLEEIQEEGKGRGSLHSSSSSSSSLDMMGRVVRQEQEGRRGRSMHQVDIFPCQPYCTVVYYTFHLQRLG